MSEQRLAGYHAYAREHGVNFVLYLIARLIVQPACLIWFRLARYGREHAHLSGPLLVAANHRSFLDPFVIAITLPWRRPLHFVAKVELFDKRWQGWLLSRLGAFPIRRGESDTEAMTTARMILERGGACASSPRARESEPARWPSRSEEWGGSRSRPARLCCRSPCSAPNTCDVDGGSGRARSSFASADR